MLVLHEMMYSNRHY